MFSGAGIGLLAWKVEGQIGREGFLNLRMSNHRSEKGILPIGNWHPPVYSWSMSLQGLRKELVARRWDCRVMNLNENRRVPSTEYFDVPEWVGLHPKIRAGLETAARSMLGLTEGQERGMSSRLWPARLHDSELPSLPEASGVSRAPGQSLNGTSVKDHLELRSDEP